MRTAVATIALANLAVDGSRPQRPAEPNGRPTRPADQSGREASPLAGADAAFAGHGSLGTRTPLLAEARRFARFLVVGLGGTAIDFVLLVLLQSIGVPLLIANSISFSAGACSNFFWNRRWTFSDARGRAWGIQMVQFFSVSLVGLAINDAVVVMLQTPLGSLLGRPGQGYLAAKVVATAVAVLWNFFANRYWTFGDAGRTDPTGTGPQARPKSAKEVDGHAV